MPHRNFVALLLLSVRRGAVRCGGCPATMLGVICAVQAGGRCDPNDGRAFPGRVLNFRVPTLADFARWGFRDILACEMRKFITLVALGVIVGSVWLIHSKVTHARRESAYRSAIAAFQHDLPIGTTRAEVNKYLGARKVDYHLVRYGGSDGDTYEIKIGEEPGNLVCEPWNVYVALEFSSADILRDVHIRKIGTCL
jgi:hypothetical protein